MKKLLHWQTLAGSLEDEPLFSGFKPWVLGTHTSHSLDIRLSSGELVRIVRHGPRGPTKMILVRLVGTISLANVGMYDVDALLLQMFYLMHVDVT